ncbi:MAG: nucleotide exchange factor GrpE, partial [bacterium]
MEKEQKSKIEKKNEALEKSLLEMENKWKRAMADYLNLEKRTMESKMEFVEYANSMLILEFLEVLDCLEIAEKHVNNEGVSLGIKKFKDTLTENEVCEIKVENEMFNPDLMEAVDTEKGEENKVLRVTKKGYTLHNRVLRPAQVVVGRK